MTEIIKPSDDPWFNLAAEEFVVKHIQDEIFMLWKNTNCIVVGKHQNTVAEVNMKFVTENEIPVIRRISGGGTVFQGIGNLNFSFVTNTPDGEDKINFRKFTSPVIEYLEELGVKAELTGKSNLTINGLKFSGNAAHLHKNRSLHHGTILFDADLDLVNKAIEVNDSNYQSKAIASNRATICNIRPMLKADMNIEAFEAGFSNFVTQKFNLQNVRGFSETETEVISKLAEEKYKSWDWNFGYSPDYFLQRKIEIEGQSLNFKMKVRKGVIVEVISEPQTNVSDEICGILLYISHRPESIVNVFSRAILFSYLNPKDINQIVNQLL
jgi:lipoate---protein ligase